MNQYISHLITKHRTTGVLIDTNLLILLCTGRYDPSLIGRFNRTDSFLLEDYIHLNRIIEQFNTIHTTPNILTEVSNLVNLKGKKLEEFSRFLSTFIEESMECYIPSIDIAKDNAFSTLGLADAAVVMSAQKYLIITVDLPLYGYLSNLGLEAINFNHIRGIGWLR